MLGFQLGPPPSSSRDQDTESLPELHPSLPTCPLLLSWWWISWSDLRPGQINPGWLIGPAVVTRLPCSPALGAVGLPPTGGVTLECPQFPVHLPAGNSAASATLLLNSGCLKLKVHSWKAILPSYCCCWSAFIKGYKRRHFKANSSAVFVKTVVISGPHSNQSSFLHHNSTKACLNSGYLGCCFLSELHYFAFALLMRRILLSFLCHKLLLLQLTDLAEGSWIVPGWSVGLHDLQSCICVDLAQERGQEHHRVWEGNSL